jgi:molybdate transport system substrate-binding protein
VTLVGFLAGLCVWAAGCGAAGDGSGGREINVAAAANLVEPFRAIAAHFEAESGIKVTLSFGSTAALAQQVENGAPFDLFAAADTAHVDGLVGKGILDPASRAVYARGTLVLWSSNSELELRRIEDLTKPGVKFVAIAKPDVAPYGRASVDALRAAGLWEAVEPKIVYAQNVLMAKQFAESGNADVALTAASVVHGQPGQTIPIDHSLYAPIEQALGIVAASPRREGAMRFGEFVLGARGQTILKKFGYDPPVGN